MAVYYVKTGGDDGADGLSDATAWASITKLNATTFSAGDTIKLRRGDTFVGRWAVLGAGTSGNPITVTNYGSGALPIVDANGASNQAIMVQVKNFWTIDGVHVKGGLVGNIQFTASSNGKFINGISTGGVIGVNVTSTSATVTISGNTINQSPTGAAVTIASTVTGTNTVSNNTIVGTAGATTTLGLDIQCATAVVTGNTVTSWKGTGTNRVFSCVGVTNLTFSNNSVTNSQEGFDFYFESCTSVTLSSCTSTGSAGQGFYLKTCTGVTASSLSVNNATSSGITITGLLGTNTFTSVTVNGASTGISITTSPVTINSSTVQNTTANGIYADGTATVTTNNCYVSVAGADGFRSQAGATMTNNYGYADTCGGDGFSNANTGTMANWYCWSSNNGTTDAADAGDGYTSHDTATHNLYYCIAVGNRKSGAMMVGASTGVIYNCTFYNNYNATNIDDYGIAIQSTAAWTIKNNITANHRTELYYSPGTLVTSDYNCCYDSRGGNAFYFNTVAYNWADYLTASSQDAHSINVDPMFFDTSTNQFHLKFGSPAIRTGTAIGDGYKVGILKNSSWPSNISTRYQETNWSMGAFVNVVIGMISRIKSSLALKSFYQLGVS